jgi:hypothetical protein
MVLFGGLEFVVGGYFIHRHYKKKSHKKKLEAEAEARRNNTFPGAGNPQRQGQNHEQLPQYQQMPPTAAPQFEYCGACRYPPRRRVPPPIRTQGQAPWGQQRPNTAQTFPTQHQIRRRPVPPPRPQQNQQQPRPALHLPAHMEPEIRPLERSDSLRSITTLSDMPIANGMQYSPPPGSQMAGLQVPSPHSPSGPYGNARFSVSVPALVGHAPSSPLGSSPRVGTVDDNWETYSPHTPLRGGGGAQQDDDINDPPPPYQP